MWHTNTLWFEVAVVSIMFVLGHIFLGHFEERSPAWRKLLKYVVTLIVIIGISIFFGRTAALSLLGLSLIPVVYVHGVVLPKRGINGWTAEPRGKYYEMRGWSKDIFGEGSMKEEG